MTRHQAMTQQLRILRCREEDGDPHQGMMVFAMKSPARSIRTMSGSLSVARSHTDIEFTAA